MLPLEKTPVFQGFTEGELEEALALLQNRTKAYQKDQTIFLEGDFVSELGIVLEGSVTIERIDYQGNKNILGINSAGQVFAESYAMTGKPLMIDVTANEDCRIFFLDIQQLKANPVQRPWVTKLLFNLVMISNRKNLELSSRSFHTVSKQIRGRVLSYLTAVSHETGCRSFEIPLNRQQMADYLNLDRSALSGELSKMRDEGLISFHKNHFELL